MTEREALKLALEALEEAADAIDSWGSYASGYFQVKHDLEGDISKAKSAITAIKEALAQPEPWEKFCDSSCVWTDHHPDCKLAQPEYQSTADKSKLEKVPAKGTLLAQPEQEPVATDWERIARVQDAKLRAMCNEAGGFEKLCEVMDKYERTTPPQRKPLTDEEINEFFQGMEPNNGFWLSFARAIEAAHGIKE